MKFEAYMIKDTERDLYSSGGSKPKLNRVGKIWRSMADLRKHIALVEDLEVYKDCYVVHYTDPIIHNTKLTDIK